MSPQAVLTQDLIMCIVQVVIGRAEMEAHTTGSSVAVMWWRVVHL